MLKRKGWHTFPNSVSEVPHISINFILSTFNCEEIKQLSFRRGMCSGNSTNSQYPVIMEDKKLHNIDTVGNQDTKGYRNMHTKD
jgi:hypothetical protein